MSELFETNQIGNIKIKNRFVRSATYEAFADPDGRSNDRLNEYMAAFAAGKVGMIITSHAYVTKQGQAGFDGVQIHSAHSYLLSQFLSPYYNQRDDDFGRSIENRSRLLVMVYEEIRKRVGTAFPVMVKINSEDFLENGLSVEETIQTCKVLEEKGIDAVELSGGTMDSGRYFFSRKGTAKSETLEGYYRDAARKFKEQIKIPLILVGGFLSYEIAKETVTSGLADMIAFSRPLIREPGLVFSLDRKSNDRC